MNSSHAKSSDEKSNLPDNTAVLLQVHHSINVIKWCILSITIIMFLAIILAVWTLNSVHKEVVRVQAEVEQVRPQVSRVVEEAVEVVDGVKQLVDGLQLPMAAAKKLLRDELVARMETMLQEKKSK